MIRQPRGQSCIMRAASSGAPVLGKYISHLYVLVAKNCRFQGWRCDLIASLSFFSFLQADLESTEPETTDIIYMDEQPVIDSATYSLPVKAMNDQAKLKQVGLYVEFSHRTNK